MKGVFILTGGGDSKYFKEIDLYFKSLMPEKSNILLIPLASNRRNHAYCLKRIKTTFRQLKFNKIDVCSDLTKLDAHYLSLFHAIYIDGGNTYQLLQALKVANTKKLFTTFLAKGGIINADSAGAIVLGRNIKTAAIGEHADDKKIDLKSYLGLNFFYGLNIHCHYRPDFEQNEVLAFSSKYGPTLCLTERTSLSIIASKVQVIGQDSAYLFSKDGTIRQIKPNKKFNIT